MRSWYGISNPAGEAAELYHAALFKEPYSSALTMPLYLRHAATKVGSASWFGLGLEAEILMGGSTSMYEGKAPKWCAAGNRLRFRLA